MRIPWWVPPSTALLAIHCQLLTAERQDGAPVRFSQDFAQPGQDFRRPGRGPVRTRGQLGTLTAVVALTLLLTGCGRDTHTGTPAAHRKNVPADRVEPLTTAPEPHLPVTVKSADGAEVTVTSAERIVPLTGSLSEIVFTLGLGRAGRGPRHHRDLRTGGRTPGGDPRS